MILDMLYHSRALMEVECLIYIGISLKNLSFKTDPDHECFDRPPRILLLYSASTRLVLRDELETS